MVKFPIPEWVRTGARYMIIGLVLPPAFGKFLTYNHSVSAFTAWGIPAAELMVVFIGVLELFVVLVMLSDRIVWVGASSIIPVMVVAFWVAPEWQAAAVAGAGLLLLGFQADVFVIDSEEGATQNGTS